MKESQLKNIFIVDDHPLIRNGLRYLFENEDLINVCGEAEDIASSLPAIGQLSPDLVIVDISLPDGNGFDLIKRLHAKMPGLPVLVSSMHDEQLMAERALRAGAMGYINKQKAPEHLVTAVKRIFAGKVYLSDAVTERMLLKNVNGNDIDAYHSPIDSLSNREFEVFEQIGGGLSTIKIAENLHLSIKTIETHRAHIKEKLKLASSTELTRYAMQWSIEDKA